MTVVEFTPNGHTSTLSDDEKRDRARADLRADPTLTGTTIGERYGMSPEWGRKQKRAAARPGGTPAAPPTGTAGVPSKPAAAQPTSRRRTAAVSTARRRVTAAAVTLVAVVAAAGSYSHMHALALEAGEGQMAVVLPLSVDGLVVAATMTLLSARRTGRRAGALPWTALLIGLGASLAANVAAAEPTVVGRLVAAWPPVALALSFELLLRQTRGER